MTFTDGDCAYQRRGKVMTTRSQGEQSSKVQIGEGTERAVRDFVRTAVLRLTEALNDRESEWEVDSRWKQGSDGLFRQYTTRALKLWPTLNDEWLRSLPTYDTCIEHLNSDPVIGPHLDHLVGTKKAAFRLEAKTILRSTMYAMLSDEGGFEFSDERFDCKWRELSELLTSTKVPLKTVAPLPYLSVPNYPLRLSNELVLDRFTDEEVTRCCEVDVLQPISKSSALIDSDWAVGIRRTLILPKSIRTGNETAEMPDVEGEGTFGSRPSVRDDLVVDDVLSALRLFKHTEIGTAGYASWTDSPWLGVGTQQYRILRQWPFGSDFQLSEAEVRIIKPVASARRRC